MTQIIHFPFSEYLKKYQYPIGLLILFFTSVFNLGFHHPDEHFQILEILNYKTNASFNPSWLPWDIHEKLRSFFQIFIYYPFELLFNKLGLGPFFKVSFYKFLTASFVYIGLMKYLKQINFEYRFLMIFFWFVPLFLARTSSESLSMGFFFWGLYHLNQKTSLNYLYCGFFFAFSCYARFPMLVAVGLVGLWAAIYHDRKWNIGFIDLGFFLGVTIGVFIDYWGYGDFTVSVWNYFKANIIESKGNQFGVEPFWYFFEKPALKGGPLGILLTISVLYYWFRRPKSQLSFWTFGYVLIHSIVSHKEIRFITPVYIMAPIMFFKINREWESWKGAINKLFKVFFVINLFYLFKVVFIANTSYISFYQYLYKNPKSKIYTLYDEHGTHLKLINKYYLKDNSFKLTPISYQDFNNKFQEKYLLTSQYRELDKIKDLNCKELYSLYPNWLLEQNPFNFRERSSIWKLHFCSEKVR